jgi:hypothetical protein
MALTFSVHPIVNSFTQATRIGIALQLSRSVEKAGLLAANPHSDRQLQARTHLLWANNGATPLVLGITT